MFLINKKKNSGVSIDVMRVWADNKGLSLEETICEEGLPNEPSFQLLIKVLSCETIDPIFKKYLVDLAQTMVKTTEDFSALSKYQQKTTSQNQPNTIATTVHIKTKITSTEKFILPEVITEIKDLHEALTLATLSRDKKEIIKKIDGIVCSLIKEAGKNAEKLFEIYQLLLPNNKRMPYLKQQLLRSNKKHLL